MSSHENTTLDRLRAILVKEYEVAPELIDPSARIDQLAIDSLAVIEVMFRLEDEFKINFPQDPGELTTVGDLVSSIDRLAAAQQARTSSEAVAP